MSFRSRPLPTQNLKSLNLSLALAQLLLKSPQRKPTVADFFLVLLLQRVQVCVVFLSQLTQQRLCLVQLLLECVASLVQAPVLCVRFQVALELLVRLDVHFAQLVLQVSECCAETVTFRLRFHELLRHLQQFIVQSVVALRPLQNLSAQLFHVLLKCTDARVGGFDLLLTVG